VISAPNGVLKGTVVSASASQLVVKPNDAPGTVTLNPMWIQRDGKWVPDPEYASRVEQLKPKARVTVQWQWNEEARKRINSITIDTPAPIQKKALEE
jgi:hypothetical protein